MKNPFARMIRLTAAGAAFLALTLAQPAHSIETTCTGSGGTNCPALIPDGPLPGVSSTLTVPADICGASTATGARVRVNLSHSWVGDLSIAVQNPASTSATLLSQLPDPPAVSCAGDDIGATFQDGGAAPVCQSASLPSISGTLAPVSPLAPLAASVAGVWTLTVTDNMHGNNGLINDWAVDVICGAAVPTDMSVTLTGFPAAVAQNDPISGTVTCANVGAAPATNATCSVVGGTASNCTLQPANTPIGSFPVASVPAGSSITCAVSVPSNAVGVANVTASTSATGDSNAANNTAAAAISIVAPGTADMAVTVAFPASAVSGTNVAGTVTCANVGSVAATNATCAVSGATLGNCTLQPANTPVASFPVASVAAGSSIVCGAIGTMPPSGSLLVAGTTSADNDSNLANNTGTDTIAAQTAPPPAPSIPAPALSWLMKTVLLGLLLLTGAWLSRRGKAS